MGTCLTSRGTSICHQLLNPCQSDFHLVYNADTALMALVNDFHLKIGRKTVPHGSYFIVVTFDTIDREIMLKHLLYLVGICSQL